MGFGSRKPNSNERGDLIKRNPYGPNDGIRDYFSVVMNGEGKRCYFCNRVVLNEHLKYFEGKSCCPDCFLHIQSV